jgi:serine phosphatase RsbU (regulator of sigma subunit)
MLRAFLLVLLLQCPAWVFAQSNLIVYDGNTGIHEVVIQRDTALISTLIPGSPAQKAGMKLGDQIIAINDSLVTGKGTSRNAIKRLLYDRAGKPIQITVKRKGEDKLLSFSFVRDGYLFQIDSYDYTYLVDSLEELDIHDIMSSSLDSLFKDPLTAKITVHSVEPGSPAEKNGLLAGDQIISLAEEVDRDYSYHISYDRLSRISPDTSIEVLRDSSLVYFFLLEPSLQGDLKGIMSQFEKDFSSSCVWLKVTTENRLETSRPYLFNVPELKGKDSLNLYYTLNTGELIEKKSGILVPVQERDFIYKNWHSVKVPLNKGENQTLYFRVKAANQVGELHLQIYAQDTIVNYDRFERMVLYGFLFTMLIISAFFLLLFAFMRIRQYLFFALYVGSLMLFLFVTDGYLDEYFWKENNFFLKFLEKFQPYIMSWISIFFLLFGIAYLELRKKLILWYRIVVTVLSLTGLRIVLVIIEAIFNFSYPVFMERIFTVLWIFTVGILPIFILIVPAIIRIRKGFQPAWYFLAANIVLIPLIYVTLYSSLYSNTVIALYEPIISRLFLTSGMYIAAILQIVIFSFGIARKMRLDEEEKKRNQQQLIDQYIENEKLKDKVNRELEQKVRERTSEISEQKEKIESQRDEIEAQRDMVFAQKKEITDSIDYAQRIQLAVLPHEKYLDQIMHEHFVLFKPKDVVSGDFFWIKEVGGNLIIVAADCTGHGVPGAFMSMLGITLLNEQLGKSKLDDPGEILDNLRSKVKEMLVQQGNVEEQKDGMDIAIAIIDHKKKVLKYAGAHNPLYLVRNSLHVSAEDADMEASLRSNGFHLIEFKGDRQPIGFHWEETKFTTYQVDLVDQDTVYLFTDGFIDQFGGEHRKKYKAHRFKELLLSFQKESMPEQKQLLENAFESWKGEIEQIDDVCIIGVKI